MKVVRRSTICCCPAAVWSSLPRISANPGAHLVFEPVEAPGGLLAESVDGRPVCVDLHAQVGEVAVAGGGQVPRGRSISGHFFDASLQRGEPGFDVGRVGDGEQRTDLRARR